MRINLTASDKKKLIDQLKNDPIMNGLMTYDFSQIDTWVENNVTNIDEAQEVIKRIMKAIKYLLANLIKEAME